MPRSEYEEILSQIHSLQKQLNQEFDHLLAEKRTKFQYNLKKGKVIFDKHMQDFQHNHRTGVWHYLKQARVAHILTAPIIYSVVFPLILLDLAVFIYQQTCFRVYGIPIVKRADYIIIDRHNLAYLNGIEKFNCMYCGYGNGLIELIREVFARTEQYWCPIKHARRSVSLHQHAENFVDYGDAQAYRNKLETLREQLRKAKKEE